MSYKSTLGRYIYSFHIPLFFVISGILLSLKKDSWKEENTSRFVTKRLKSLLYPYITFSVVSIIYIFLKNATRENDVLITELEYAIVSTVSFEGILTLWYLPVLFLAEVLLVVTVTNAKKSDRYLWVTLVAVIAFNLYTMCYLQNCDVFTKNLLIMTNRVAIGYFFLVIGFLMSEFGFLLYVNKPYLFGTMMIALNLYLFRKNSYVDIHYALVGNLMLFYTNALLGCIGIIILLKKLDGKITLLKPFELLGRGKNSLIIFATHLNLGVYDVAVKIGNTVTNNYRISCLIATIIILVIECIVIGFVNRFCDFLVEIPCWIGRKAKET